MLRCRTQVSGALLLFGLALQAAKLPKPARTPEPPSAEQVVLIRQGVALHDEGDYQSAIAKYRQVLAENPWEVTALHELGLSYFAGRNYQLALDTALLGAQCRSRGLAGFYVLIGNALDEMGRGAEAIETYKAAIKLDPSTALLHYNFAISLHRAGKPRDAKAEVERDLELDPSHASGHVTLASIYQEMGYRMPAILAYSRFLSLEWSTPRAAQARAQLMALIKQGVGQGKNPNQINILMTAPSKDQKDEGDFSGAELMLSFMQAAEFIKKPAEAEKAPPQTPFEKLASLYDSLGESLGNLKAKRGFAARYYAPFFTALSKAGHTQAFLAQCWQKAQLEGSTDWTAANAGKIMNYLAWSKSYTWSAK